MSRLTITDDPRGGHLLNNYQRKLDALIASGEIKPGDIASVSIAHDQWCEIYQGSFCNCDPDISVHR